MNPPYRAFSLDKKLLELQPFTTYKKIQKQITLPTFLLGYSYRYNNLSRRINRESNGFFVHILQ